MAGKGKCAAPLTCACFGDEPFNAELLVIPRLRDSGIWLMAAGRAGAFVFVVYFCGCFKEPFEVNGPSQWCRSPPIEDIEDFLGDINPAFCADFLLDEVHREDRGQHFWADGFAIRAERRQRRGGEVGGEVVPFAWYVFFFQMNFDVHFLSPSRTAITVINTGKAFIGKILGRYCQEDLFGFFEAKRLTTPVSDALRRADKENSNKASKQRL